ncbi:hypothetical protein TPHA_0A00730 [Tetrapisispora phaffii CBS 4417]|uniref:Uncharacterized protein n=1 Tax=Tetrapisispora phaffii (strain ATCC 24235 / CBS 4417 / NBRC 1672 / NRRL Y-8282 / UCD 70-5) TaxID=1071381 RepID=G8BMN0_TETPH|nr:hypothetical protein TPHA_0A00730 [Tetrapisispora phaffii CBS 4417]CCE61158.1 hypothetical protein TPHA_0A00730 [Tetrapisispora phaffii CBS 4417]
MSSQQVNCDVGVADNVNDNNNVLTSVSYNENQSSGNLKESQFDKSEKKTGRTHRGWLRRSRGRSENFETTKSIKDDDTQKNENSIESDTEDIDINDCKFNGSGTFRSRLQAIFKSNVDLSTKKPGTKSSTNLDKLNVLQSQDLNASESEHTSSRWKYRLRNHQDSLSQISLSRSTTLNRDAINDLSNAEKVIEMQELDKSLDNDKRFEDEVFLNEIQRKTTLNQLKDNVQSECSKSNTNSISDIGKVVARNTDNDDDVADLQSNSSSIERAAIVKEKCENIFSPADYKMGSNIQYESPITPSEGTVEKSYKHVFETPRQFSIINPDFDNIIVENNSNVNKTLEFLFKILKAPEKSIVNQDSHLESKTPTLNNVLTELSNLIVIKLKEDERLQRNRDSSEHLVRRLECDVSNLERDLKSRNDQITNLLDSRAELENCIDKVKNVMDDILKCKSISRVDDTKVSSQGILEMLPTFYDSITTVLDDYGKLQIEYDSISNKSQDIQNECKNLILELETSQEKVLSLESKLSESTKLQAETFRRHSHSHALPLLRRTNEKLQIDYQRERSKVLELRKEHKNKDKFLKAYEIYRTESLQFMIYLMHSFRSFATDESIVEYDNHVKSLNEFYFNSNIVKEAGEREIEIKCQKFTNDVTSFYQEVAKSKFLDQLLEKYLSFMLSNEFLSTKITGLRRQNQDYEIYANHLLEKLNDVTTHFQSEKN